MCAYKGGDQHIGLIRWHVFFSTFRCAKFVSVASACSVMDKQALCKVPYVKRKNTYNEINVHD